MTKQDKVAKVMHEWKQGKLTSHGRVVTDYDQAVAIALSEAGLSKKYAKGGWVLYDEDDERLIKVYETESEARKNLYEYEGNANIVEKSSWDNNQYAEGGVIDADGEIIKKGYKVTNGRGLIGIVKEIQTNGLLYIQWTSDNGEETTDLTADNDPEELYVLSEYEKGGNMNKYARGGSFTKKEYDIPYDLKITGIYTLKTSDGKEYKFAITGFERENDDEFAFLFSGWNREENNDLRAVIVKNSAIRKMSKGETVIARTPNGEKGKLTRIADSFMGMPIKEENMNKYSKGGGIGNEQLNLVFSRQDDFKKAKYFYENESSFYPSDINDEFRTFVFDVENGEADVTEHYLGQELQETDLDGYYFEVADKMAEGGGMGRYAKGGLTNERRYVNKSQDYEVRYAKDKPMRKGYNDERMFEGGGEMGKKLKGYRVYVFESSLSSSQNVLNGDSYILVTDGVHGDSSEVDSDEVYLKLVKRNLFGKEYVHAEPINVNKRGNQMFGGKFVWSSDSRFREDISEQPIQLHDRVESYALGGGIDGWKGSIFNKYFTTEEAESMLDTLEDNDELNSIDVGYMGEQGLTISVINAYTDRTTSQNPYNLEMGSNAQGRFFIIPLKPMQEMPKQVLNKFAVGGGIAEMDENANLGYTLYHSYETFEEAKKIVDKWRKDAPNYNAIITKDELDEKRPYNVLLTTGVGMGKRVYAVGGEIGNTVTFSRYGERTTGRVTDKLRNGYEVATDDGVILVEPQEVISFSDEPIAKKKRFGFFEGGGSVEEYKQAERDYDKYGEYLEDAIEDENESDIKKYKRLMDEAETKMHRYERKYAGGGEIENKIEKLKKVVSSKMLPESVKAKAQAEIDKLEKELHESKETKVEEKEEHEARLDEKEELNATIQKLYDIEAKAEDLINYQSGGIQGQSVDKIKKYVEYVNKEVSKLNVPFGSEVFDVLEDENAHSLNLTLGLLGLYKNEKDNGDWAKAQTSYKNLVDVVNEVKGGGKPEAKKPTTKKAPVKKAPVKKAVVKTKVDEIRDKVISFLNPLGYYATITDNKTEIYIEPSTRHVGKNRADFFNGMQIIYDVKDKEYEVSEYQAGKGEDELHIYKVTPSLTLALKDLIKGNKRKPIKIWGGKDEEKAKTPAKPKADHKKLVAKLKAKKGGKEYDNRASLVPFTDKRRERSESSDKKRSALPPGKRVSENGVTYYENRLNRTDLSKKDKFEKGGEVKGSDWGLNLNW